MRIISFLNAGYFADVGDDELQKQQEEKKSNSKKDSTDKNKTEGSDDMEEDEVEKLESTAAFYPLKKFEYTDHQASIREIIVNGVNDIKESLSKLHDMLSGDEDDEKDSNEDTSQTDESAIKDDEIYPLIFDAKDDKKDNAVISNVGTIVNHDKEKEIIENSDYRMTIQSTERFFDWCTGSDGSKEMLLLILLIIYVVVTRVLRVCANAVLSPIAICNFFDGSRHSDGMRFIKKTLAMCLQCSAIMIICAASTSLYSYITTDASRSSIFRGSAESHENVIKAKNSMVKSQSVNINALRDATEQARQNIGYVAYDDPDLHKHSATATPTTSNTYINAAYKLTQTKIAKIKEDKEEEYKKYEDTLGIQVFVRDKNGHYKYTKKGYAKLDDKYKIFNEEKMTTFMNMLLGGTNWLTMVFILVAKAGLIKKSNSICNVIVGV